MGQKFEPKFKLLPMKIEILRLKKTLKILKLHM